MLKSFAPPLVPASAAVTVQEIASSRPGGDTVYNTSIAASPAPRSAWIVSPVIDFLFGCGGLVWILFLLHYYFLNGSGTGTIAEALIITSSLGAVCLSETHTAATLVAGFRHAKSPGLLRSALYLMAALSLALAVFGIALPGAASILVKVYLLIIP